MKILIRFIAVILSAAVLSGVAISPPCVMASESAGVSLSLSVGDALLPPGAIVSVEADLTNAQAASGLEFYEMGKLVSNITDLDGELSYKVTAISGIKPVYARLVDADGSVMATSGTVYVRGYEETVTDTMWDIDFEDEYFHLESSAPEWRYLYDADDKLMSVTRGGAESTLRAHTGDTSNDMTIEHSGDVSHGKAIKITTSTGAQNQFNEFRARNSGEVMVCEWEYMFTAVPPSQSSMAVKIMEPNIAPDMSGNSEILTPYIALLYKSGVPYLGWTDGTDNSVEDVYWGGAETDTWYNIKTYTDFENGVVTYYIDNEYIASHSFDHTIYKCAEKYRTSFYNASGAQAWVDNFKVYQVSHTPMTGIGGVEYKINNETTDDITDGELTVAAYISNDGTERDCVCYVAVYDVGNTLFAVYDKSISFANGETQYTAFVDAGSVTADMTVKTFLWHTDGITPVSASSKLTEYIPETTPETYWKVDFENGSRLSAMFGAKNNILEQGTDEYGNGCVMFERAAANDFHLDMYIAPYPSDSIVYQYDVKLLSKDVSYTSYLISSQDNAWQYTISSGTLTAGDNSAALSVGNWHTVSAVYKPSEAVFDIYLDYKAVCRDVAVSESYSHADAQKWRLHANRTSGDDKFYIDNIAVYNSSVPCRLGRGFVISDAIALYESDDEHKAFLEDKVSYHLRSGVLYANGNKEIVTPVVDNGIAYVPLTFFEKAFDMQTSYDTLAKKANIGGIELEADSYTANMQGAEVTLSAKPRLIEDDFYVPLKTFAEQCLGKSVQYDNSTISGGFVILSDTETDMSAVADLQKLNDFMLYLRPSKEKIAADFGLSCKGGVHPRVMADTDDFARIRSLVTTDDNMRWWADKIIAQADELCGDDTPLIYELRDGVRLLYVSYDMIDHMFTLGMAYQLTGDKKYADRAWIDLESVAGFDDWHPQHALDVGAMACGYAVGYDWMHDAFTPKQRAYIEQGALNNGIYTYVEGYQNRNSYMANGITMANNWAMVMNGGAAMLGTAFYDAYPEYSAYLIASSIRCLEFAIYNYAPDGGWFEGMGYAGMTLEYLTYQLASIKDIFGTVYTLDATEGLDGIPEFYLYMQSPQGCFGYNDGASQNVHFDAGMLWIGDHYNDYATLKTYNDLFVFGTDVRTLLWYNPDKLSGTTELSLDKLYTGQQVLTMRDTWDKNEHNVFAGMKGYVSDFGHGHMDHGSFMFYSGGTRWTHDFGSENYNVPGYWQGATYDAARWQYYRVRGEGHNTLIINPDQYAEFDPTKTAEFVRFEANENGVIGVIDTTEANMGKAKSVQRGTYFADDRTSLVVRDEIVTNGESTMYWFLHTTQDAKLTEDGKGIILTDKNNVANFVNLDFTCNKAYELSIGPSVPLETSPKPEGMTDDSATNVIILKVVADGEVNITAKLTPCTAINARSVAEFDMPMSQWVIPE